MAATKISELPAADALTGIEQIPLIQGGSTKRAAASAFDAAGAASSAVIAHSAATDPHGDRAYSDLKAAKVFRLSSYLPGDGQWTTDVATVAGSATINSARALWKPSDQNKPITVGRSDTGVATRTTILTYVSPTRVILAAPIGFTSLGADPAGAVWGTDAGPGMQAALLAMSHVENPVLEIDALFRFGTKASQLFTNLTDHITIRGGGTDCGVLVDVPTGTTAMWELFNTGSVTFRNLNFYGTRYVYNDCQKMIHVAAANIGQALFDGCGFYGVGATQAVVYAQSCFLKVVNCKIGGCQVAVATGFGVFYATLWQGVFFQHNKFTDYATMSRGPIQAPDWAANTVYAAGFIVKNPSGAYVAATVAFTSGAAYSAANWTAVIGRAVTTAAKNSTQAGPWITVGDPQAYSEADAGWNVIGAGAQSRVYIGHCLLDEAPAKLIYINPPTLRILDVHLEAIRVNGPGVFIAGANARGVSIKNVDRVTIDGLWSGYWNDQPAGAAIELLGCVETRLSAIFAKMFTAPGVGVLEKITANPACGIVKIRDDYVADLSGVLCQLVVLGNSLTRNMARTITAFATALDVATVTGPAGAFLAGADEGKVVTATGVPTGTTILSIQSATAATLSAPATATGSVTATVGPVGEPALAAGLVIPAGFSAVFYRDDAGRVCFEGTVKNTSGVTMTAGTTTLLTFPAGFRPRVKKTFTADNDGIGAVPVTIAADGIMTSANAIAANASLHFDGAFLP